MMEVLALEKSRSKAAIKDVLYIAVIRKTVCGIIVIWVYVGIIIKQELTHHVMNVRVAE